MSVRRSALPMVQVASGHLDVLAFLVALVALGWPLLVLTRSSVGADIALVVPGAAAVIITGRVGLRATLRRLSLDRLGWPDAYLLALWMPVLLVAGRIALVVVLGAGRLDDDVAGLHPADGSAPVFAAVAQLVAAVLVAPFLQLALTLWSEVGWRAFVLPRLLPLGQWPAITLTSLLWWMWQLPLIVDPRSAQWPVALTGSLFWCLFVGEILGWLYLRTRSVWAPALFSATIAALSYLPAAVLREVSPDAATTYGPAALIVPALVVLLIRQRSQEGMALGR